MGVRARGGGGDGSGARAQARAMAAGAHASLPAHSITARPPSDADVPKHSHRYFKYRIDVKKPARQSP